MDDVQIDDLKQFIAATVSQTEVRLDQKIEVLDQKVENLRQEMTDGFAGVGEAIEQIHTRVDDNQKITDARLTKLEQNAA
jgi:hypothetical protein